LTTDVVKRPRFPLVTYQNYHVTHLRKIEHVTFGIKAKLDCP